MAVFTPLSQTDMESICSNYAQNIGTLISYDGILQGVDNTNYKLQTTNGRYILTLFESRIHPRDIPYFLIYMAHLAKSGINCPAPIIRDDATLTGNIHGKTCAIFSFLEGRDVKPADITPALCSELGSLVGRMHVAGQSMSETRHNSMSFEAWNVRIGKVGVYGNRIVPDLDVILSNEMNYIQANWPRDLPDGNVHLDLFPDNVFCQTNDGVDVSSPVCYLPEGTHICGVIDFYFAATDFLAYDLAIIMNAWCFSNNGTTFEKAHWDALLTAYESVRPLTRASARLSRFWHAVPQCGSCRPGFMIWSFMTRKIWVQPKDPTEYINIMKFHQDNGVF